MAKRKKVVAYLTPENERNFTAHVERSGMAQSAIVNYALAEFYNRLQTERKSFIGEVNRSLEDARVADLENQS